MSRENVEVVRQPIARKARLRRGLEDRLIVGLRPAFVLLTRLVWRLPPSSRVRQRFLRHGLEVAVEAHNRRDLAVTFALFHESCESTFPAQMGGLGSASATRGREERLRFHRTFLEEWGEYRLEPEELIDTGDRVLVLGRMKGTGLSSGAVFDNEWALLTATSAGQVIREEVFLDHGQALEAVGLRE
jgi:ketosteroid isomerase-like protein